MDQKARDCEHKEKYSLPWHLTKAFKIIAEKKIKRLKYKIQKKKKNYQILITHNNYNCYIVVALHVGRAVLTIPNLYIYCLFIIAVANQIEIV